MLNTMTGHIVRATTPGLDAIGAVFTLEFFQVLVFLE